MKAAFVGGWFDGLIVGGLSIVTYIAMLIWGDHFSSLDLFSFAIAVAIFINGPHFLISYLLFYRLAAKRVLKESLLFAVAFIIPLIICLAWIMAGIFSSPLFLTAILYMMLFLVGWHYVRQGFGILMVYSSNDRNFFSLFEREVIKWSLYTLWFGSFCNIFSSGGIVKEFWGLKYSVPSIPHIIPLTFGWLAVVSLVPLSAVIYARYMRGIHDNPVGLIGIFVQYLWLLPVIKHPQFLIFIPLFHSLQYLLFAGNVVSNYEKLRDSSAAKKNILFCWWGMAFILAALFFEVIPKTLDDTFGAPQDLDMPHFYLLGFILLINIHHYFIDAVLWKREVGLVRPYLKPHAAAP